MIRHGANGEGTSQNKSEDGDVYRTCMHLTMSSLMKAQSLISWNHSQPRKHNAVKTDSRAQIISMNNVSCPSRASLVEHREAVDEG